MQTLHLRLIVSIRHGKERKSEESPNVASTIILSFENGRASSSWRGHRLGISYPATRLSLDENVLLTSRYRYRNTASTMS